MNTNGQHNEEEEVLKTEQASAEATEQQPKTENSESKETTTKEAVETKEETKETQKEETVEEKIAKLEQELEEQKSKFMYKVAEFDNYRKRTIKEKTELILNGGEKVLSAILPVLDDFERARQNLKNTEDVNALREGLELILQKLNKVLENQGLKVIQAVGQDFNTDFHEAIAMIPAASDEQKGKVIDCVQTGYMLNEKVIRHAKVAIGQ